MNKFNKSTKSTSNKLLYPELSYKIVGAFYNIRNSYGSGHKELVYQKALAEELEEMKIPYKREVSIMIKSIKTNKTLGNYRLDFVIDEKIVVELKAMKFTPAKIEQQLYSYLRSTDYLIGYLVNIGSTNIYIKRIILTEPYK